MAFSRAAAFRTFFRAARPTTARPQLFRQTAQRGYASGAHGSAKAGGDAVWAAGAVAVTVPTCWYLLANGSDTSHGHDDHGEVHGKSHGDEEEAEEESKDVSEEKTEDSSEEKEDSEKSEDSDSEEDEKETDTPDTSDDEEEDEKTTKKDGNSAKSVPDAKGGIKKRIESEKGIKQGEGETEGGDGEPKDKAAASKAAGGKGSQSSKQEGLTNTDTKHSTDITNDPTNSKKGEGAPETAKVKGTVDPNRPQPEGK